MYAETEVISLIRKIYNRHKGRYGYRRIHAELIKSHVLQINHKKVLRLMREIGLKSKIRSKKQYFGISESYKSPNIMNRDFIADKPLNKLSTDVTYLKINESKYYLSVIFDLFNNEVQGYEISQHNDISLVLNSLSNSNLMSINTPILQLGLNKMTPIEYRRHYEKMAFL